MNLKIFNMANRYLKASHCPFKGNLTMGRPGGRAGRLIFPALRPVKKPLKAVQLLFIVVDLKENKDPP